MYETALRESHTVKSLMPIYLKGLRFKVESAFLPLSTTMKGIKVHLDCMQTVMHARGALIPLKEQRQEQGRPQNSVMRSHKTRPIVKNYAEISAKVRTSEASGRRACQLGEIFEA